MTTVTLPDAPKLDSPVPESGKIAILLGDYHDWQLRKTIPCTQFTREIAMGENLWPACTEIIRFQHGNSSSKKEYSTSFIPGLHDTVLIYQRA